MNTLKNRNILITGATSGLGKELSIYFDLRVKSLICIGKSYTKIKLLKKRLKNKRNIYFSGDLSRKKKLRSSLSFLNKEKNIVFKKISDLDNDNQYDFCLIIDVLHHIGIDDDEKILKLISVSRPR